MENKEIFLNEEMFGLSINDRKLIKGVFEKFSQVEEVIIYGSRSKGNYKPYSDIDFTLFGKELSQKLLFEIELGLDDLMLPYVFDLNINDKISNPDLLDHITRVGKRFYKLN